MQRWGGPPRGAWASPEDVIAAWKPGDLTPEGYRPTYKYNMTEIYAGGGILAGSFLITTLIASTIVASGSVSLMFAPAAGVPVVGAYPVAAVGATTGLLPEGTVGVLVALGVLQDIGFGVLMHGLASRKKDGIVEDCKPVHGDGWSLRLAPMVSPNVAGVALGGAL